MTVAEVALVLSIINMIWLIWMTFWIMPSVVRATNQCAATQFTINKDVMEVLDESKAHNDRMFKKTNELMEKVEEVLQTTARARRGGSDGQEL